MKRYLLIFATVILGLSVASTAGGAAETPAASQANAGRHGTLISAPDDLTKIKHVVVIMQENHSYDNYFGTFPNSNGFPTDGNGHFADSTCLQDIVTGTCHKPYHSTQDGGIGGEHDTEAALADINHGAMDGFLIRGQSSYGHGDCALHQPEKCIANSDVMSYRDAREIPNYWAYAQNYALADKTFESVPTWSGPSHLYMVSEWAAKCSSADPMSCVGDYIRPFGEKRLDRCSAGHTEVCPFLSWTDMTWLLNHQDKSWGYFVQKGMQPDCYEAGTPKLVCNDNVPQDPETPSIWNPLPFFETVQQNGQVDNVQDVQSFYTQASSGTLPNVSWVVPAAINSEHPNQKGGNRLTAGQAWTTKLINSVMNGPDWDSTAIFVTWDDWGGWYDHVKVPSTAGIRIPLLIISPYAKQGYVDHTYYGIDSMNRFIEDVFLGGQRLDPATDGRPDSRPTVNEMRNFTGDLTNAFDFTQSPAPPLVLPLHPLPGPPSCIDDVCDTHYTSDVSTRLLQTGVVRFPMTVHGSGFQAGAQVSFSGFRTGQRTTISNVDVVNSSTVTFEVSITRAASTGWANVDIKNPDDTIATCNACVQVVAGPTVSSMAPSSAAAGTSRGVTITGTNFETGARVASTSGVKVQNTTVTSSTTITGTLTVSAATPSGDYKITVTNPNSAGAGTGSCSCLTVTG